MAKEINTSSTYQILNQVPGAEITARWEDLLSNCDRPTHYVSPDFFNDPFAGDGHRFAVLVSDGDRIDAVATGMHNDGTATCGLEVRPQVAVRRSAGVSVSIMLASGILHAVPAAGLVDIHTWGPLLALPEIGFTHRESKDGDRVIMLDLSIGAESIFKEFSTRRRTDLRKTLKLAEVEVKQLETHDELLELYSVHCRWAERKGIRAESLSAFEMILGSPYRKTFIAFHEDRLIAGTFVRYYPGGVAEYAANNSLDEFQSLRANELLGWRAIEWACSAGLTHFSLGASHPFLQRFGGEIVASHRYRMDRTLFRRHIKREALSRMAVRAYTSLPSRVRTRIKAFASS